jgi:hypothetical protein
MPHSKQLTKPSNPKEAFGDVKMALGLVPDTAMVEVNLAFLEGALKYGQYNWRIAGVKASTYNRAMRRHLMKWWNGQNRDPATQVKELASVMACCAILIDAEACGMLNDDRPPRADMERVLADAAQVAAHLKQLFAAHTPPQYTEREHGRTAAEVLRGSPKSVTWMDAPAAYRHTGIVPAGTKAPKKRNPTSRKKLLAIIAAARR